MKLTRRQRGKLRALVHNISESEQMLFAFWRVLDEQKEALEIDFPIDLTHFGTEIEILGEKRTNNHRTTHTSSHSPKDN